MLRYSKTVNVCVSFNNLYVYLYKSLSISGGKVGSTEGDNMLEEYYARIAMINSNPDLLKDKSDEEKIKLKDALDKVSEKMEGSDDELEEAMNDFIATFDDLGLGEISGEKTRSLSLKKGTNLPRQIINDVTIMTLKNF